MQKYKLIVADTTNPTYSKMTAVVAQAIAAGFGYPNSQLMPRADQVLVFNPNAKTVSVVQRGAHDVEVTMAFTADYLVGSLQNPELNVQRIVAGDGIHDASVWDDSITFRSNKSRLVGCVTVPKDFIRKVMNTDQPTNTSSNNLPEVSFDYPDSDRPYENLFRVVRVTEANANYICGMEVSRGNRGYLTEKEYIFKKYRRNRIQGDINLRSFKQ